MDNQHYIHTMEFYSATQRVSVIPTTTRVILSEEARLKGYIVYDSIYDLWRR